MYTFWIHQLLAYIENEDGVTEIETILLETLDDRHTLYVSVVSCIEIFYISFQEQGQVVATARLELLKELPLIQEPLDENGIAAVGVIKATHAMSFADCCIPGLAKEKNAILIHKDPEFEQVEHEISHHKLPYKTKNL